MTIKAIQTKYAGCLFRSRLEARWAVAFDRMGLKWEYEPEGFQLPSGTWYLPDFKVTLASRESLWFEVKPDGGESKEFLEFMQALTNNDRGAILRSIPDLRYFKDTGKIGVEVFWGDGGSDNPFCFCACPSCNVVGFEFDGISARIGCECNIHYERDNLAANHPLIARAFTAALSARFEHGETP